MYVQGITRDREEGVAGERPPSTVFSTLAVGESEKPKMKNNRTKEPVGGRHLALRDNAADEEGEGEQRVAYVR